MAYAEQMYVQRKGYPESYADYGVRSYYEQVKGRRAIGDRDLYKGKGILLLHT